MQKTTPNLDHINNLTTRYGMSQSDIARAWGLGPGTMSGWKSKGHAPFWTLAAAEGLARRQRAEKDKRKTLVVQIPAEHVSSAKKILESLDSKVYELHTCAAGGGSAR